ncbi:adenylate/guanylate cyclase domain-containing protein [Methylobacterium goesingense]|nr:adenylate/guanylate cyclase domain-containing protein [Methylobacterium goesingense]GJD73295.1 hypothetical protein CFIICLFH_1522 [Methylobacterium goesingense]
MESVAQGMACVLFCDVVGSTRLYERLGDAAAHRIVEEGLRDTSREICAHGGQVVKTIGDEIMAVFPDAVSAWDAAVTIQTRQESVVRSVGATPESAIQYRIGFHFGGVIRSADDYFGATVNVAARMASIAKAGQIMTTAATVEGLPLPYRMTARLLAAAYARGLGEDVAVAEVLWQFSSEHTVMPSIPLAPRASPTALATLRLTSGDRRWTFAQDSAPISIGRAEGNDVIVTQARASRHHATIERQRDRWVLIDHSTNGTFVHPVGAQEFSICREALVLHAAGKIGFGRSSHLGGDDEIDFVIGS